MGIYGQSSASYKFNSFEEIKSHSSVLYNERMAILFYLLDMRGVEMNTDYDMNKAMEVRALLKQIYKNIRTLIRNNPTMRATLNLDTKEEGIYVTDVQGGLIDRMIEYCCVEGFTTRRLYIIINELNNYEMSLKDILQYYSYFIRPDFRQKPDIDTATEKYKEIADKTTVEELKKLVGKRNKIDFDNLGTSRIELQEDDEEIDDEEIDNEDELENEEDYLIDYEKELENKEENVI